MEPPPFHPTPGGVAVAGAKAGAAPVRCLAVAWASDQLDGVTGAFFLAAAHMRFSPLPSGSVTLHPFLKFPLA